MAHTSSRCLRWARPRNVSSATLRATPYNQEANADLRRAKIKAVRLHAIFPPWIHAAFGVGLALLLYTAGARWIQGDEDMVEKVSAVEIVVVGSTLAEVRGAGTYVNEIDRITG